MLWGNGSAKLIVEVKPDDIEFWKPHGMGNAHETEYQDEMDAERERKGDSLGFDVVPVP